MFVSTPDERTLSVAMLGIFPRIQPPKQYLINLFAEYDDTRAGEGGIFGENQSWKDHLTSWLVAEAGLLVEDNEGSWDNYRLIDQKKYAFSLLRYS